MKPGELVEKALAHLLAHDMTAFSGLWAETGTMEFPFAPPGSPQRLDGRAAVRDYLSGYPEMVDVREITECRLHQSVDPEVVIAEFEAAGMVPASGKPYTMRYIAVITVRDGEIQNYRDYWSPLAAAQAIGGANEFAAFCGAAR